MPVKVGDVISVIGNRTAAIRTSRIVKHPVYGKYQKRYKKHWADNLVNASIGDTVEIEHKKISKTKNFNITRILKKSNKDSIS